MSMSAADTPYVVSVLKGEAESQNGLGIMYRDGLGVKPDLNMAAHYFKAAAGQDLAEAHVNLAKLFICKPLLETACGIRSVTHSCTCYRSTSR